MNKLTLITAASALLLASGATVAGLVGPTGNPGNGNQRCVYEENKAKNPGQALRAVRDITGMNPKDAADYLEMNVGEMIDTYCGIADE